MWGHSSPTEKRDGGVPEEEVPAGTRHKSRSTAGSKLAGDQAASSARESPPPGTSSCRHAAALAGEMDPDENPAGSLAEGAAADTEGSRGGSPGPGQLRVAASTPPLKERLRSNARSALGEQARSRRSPTPTEEVEMPGYRAADQAAREWVGYPAAPSFVSSAAARPAAQAARHPATTSESEVVRTSLTSEAEVRRPGPSGTALHHPRPGFAASGPSNPARMRAESDVGQAAVRSNLSYSAALRRGIERDPSEAPASRREAAPPAVRRQPRVVSNEARQPLREMDFDRGDPRLEGRLRPAHSQTGRAGGSVLAEPSRPLDRPAGQPRFRQGQPPRQPPSQAKVGRSNRGLQGEFARPQDEHLESVSHVDQHPLPDTVYVDGQGPGSTSNGRVNQWLRYADSDSQQSFNQWRADEEAAERVQVARQGEREPRLVQCKVQRRDGRVEPLELYYDPSLGLPPTGIRPPLGQPEASHMAESSAFRPYGGNMPAQRRLAAEAEDFGPRLRAADPLAGGEGLAGAYDDRDDDVRSEVSRVSCTSDRLRELIRQAMEPRVVRIDQGGDQPQGPTRPSETAPKEVAGPKGPPPPQDHQVSAGGETNVAVPPAAAPRAQFSATSMASNGLTKPKKLRGFSGGKTETWETYRAHLDIVRRVNAWDDSTTLASFAAELSGPALDYYSSLPERDVAEFGKVMEVMSQRFSTLANPRAVRGRLEKLRQGADQSIEDLAQEVRNLVSAVYQDYPWEQQEREAVHAFMRAVTSKDVVQALIQSGPVTTMEQALTVSLAVRDLGQVYLGKPKLGAVRRVVGELSEDERGVVTEDESCWSEGDVDEVRAVASGSRYQSGTRGTGNRYGRSSGTKPRGTCWLCGESQHFAQDCDYRPSNWPEWLKKDVKSTIQGNLVLPPVCVQPEHQPPPRAAAQPNTTFQPPPGQPAAAQPAALPSAMQPLTDPALQPSWVQASAGTVGPRLAAPQTQQNAAAVALRMASDLVAGIPSGDTSQTSSQGKATGKNKRKRNKRKQPAQQVPSGPNSPVTTGQSAPADSQQVSQQSSQSLGN